MGFEALLRFKLAYLPGILAYWIVLNFEIASSSIVLISSNKLHVDVEDVHVTLGFPKGSLEIRRKKRLESHSFADALAERVGKDKMQLLDTDGENEMYADSEVGNNFKRCFLMLMENALIETPGDGYLKPKITSFVDDVSNVADYNWCNYTLFVIFSTRKNWELRKWKHFSGPVVFLVLCYVDRMVHCTRTVERCFPTFLGWTAENLKKRQKDEKATGGFGKAFLTPTLSNDALDRQKDIHAKEESIIFAEDFGDKVNPQEDQPPTESNIHKKFIDELLAAGKQIADAITDFVGKLSAAPANVRDMDCFKIATNTCRTLVGLTDRPESTSAKTVLNFTQAMEDGDLNNPEWLEAIEVMMKGIDTRLEIESQLQPIQYSGLDDIDSNTTTKGVVEDVVSPGVDKIGVTETEINDNKNTDDTQHRTTRSVASPKKANVTTTGAKEQSLGCKTTKQWTSTVHKNDVHPGASHTPVVPKFVCTNDTTMESGKNTKAALKQQATDKEKNDACTHNANKPTLRSRWNMGAPEMLRSPFNDRAITMGYHLAVEEKKVYYWVLSMKNEATELIVYNNHDIIVMHEDITSLVPYCKITVGVIDAWCCHLNDMEHLRGPSSPSRLFITSAICTYTIVQPRAHWNEKKAMSKFRERILAEFKYIGNFQLCAYNLIFFPIYASDHHYLVCFNFLKPAMTIIDSAKPPGNDYGIEKYGDVPAKLKKYFLHMLEYCNLDLEFGYL
ncbi:hypothetical protein AAHA92_06551 [Salvia divinorum]|uniref:Ubiquitin-like protease family profile domain-containing protein n=1 Tax=Salvia divinorum TaxID=28513 RepID=A0ABD1I940_SALDI